MTTAVEANSGFLAFYIGRDRKWHVARDARGLPITCETEALALSVACYRRKRLRA